MGGVVRLTLVQNALEVCGQKVDFELIEGKTWVDDNMRPSELCVASGAVGSAARGL